MKTADLFKRASEILSIIIFLTGLAVLAGWIFDIPSLKSILPNFVTMKANSAICFVLIGLSLWFFQEKRIANNSNRLIAYFLAAIVFLVGFLSFYQCIFGLNLGIDQLLFKEPAGAVYTNSPGRMALNTAINFTFIGIALFLLEAKAAIFLYLAQLLIILVGLVALFTLMGYLYGAMPLYMGLHFSTAMALHTAALFIMIFFCYLFARPKQALMKYVSSEDLGSFVLRRVLPIVVFVPLVLGWLKTLSDKIGLFTHETGIAMLAVSNLSIMGVLVYIICVNLDKSDVKRKILECNLQDSENKFRTLISNLPEAVYRCKNDAHGNVEFISYAIRDICGYPASDFISNKIRSYESIIYVQDRKFVREKVEQALSKNEIYVIDYRIMHADGSLRWVHERGQGIFAEKGLLYLDGVIFDITEQKKLTDSLEHASVELEKKNRELQKIDVLKSEFVSIVSHELRTPLSIIREGISLVLDGIPGTINPKQNTILNTSKDNIDRLTRIINNLLDISKIESGKIELKKRIFDLNELIKRAANSFEPKIKERGLEIKLDLPADKTNIFADEDRVFEILVNLLGNSIKFTEKGYIAITVVDREEAVECVVSDTGIGIKSENMEKLFKKFTQFDRIEGGGERGTGLGLSIIKGLVQLHGGKVWIESQYGGRGTKVYFTLPKQP